MNLLENQQAAETIDSVYVDLEAMLMQNIARHFKDWEQPIDSDKWLILKLAEIGKLNKENLRIIAQMSGLSRTAAERMLNELAEEAIQDMEPGFRYLVREGLANKAVDAAKSKNVKQVMKRMREQANDALNLTNTTMLHKASEAFKSVVFSVSEEAIKILNSHAGAVMTGAEARQQALRTVIKQFNEKGITGFVDKRGRNWTPEAYVNMAMRNTAKNVAEEVQTARCLDHGINLIEISSHSGARPKCARDQGKIFDLNNGSGTTEDLNGRKIKFFPWNSSSYGEPDGILGINCHHHKFPFIPGVSIQRHFPTEAFEENDRLYKQTQVQRALERDVRKQKRECMLYDTLEDKETFEEAAVKLKTKEAKLRDYVNEHKELHRRKDREQVVGFDKRISAEAIAANKRAQKIGKMADIKNTIDWSKTAPSNVSREDKLEIMSYAKERNINIVDLSKFDGDKELLKGEVDALSSVMIQYPEVTKRKITLTVGDLPDDDFAITRNRTIILNSNVLRDRKIAEENIKKAGIFASPRPEHIVVHEFGHIVSRAKGNKGIEIAKKAYYNLSKEELSKGQILVYLEEKVSAYSTEYSGDYERDLERGGLKETKFEEIIPEVMAKHENRANKFTTEFARLLKEI